MSEEQNILEQIRSIPLPSKDVWAFYKWRDMYSDAVTYPDNPTTQDMDQMESLIRARAYFLPCPRCKPHFMAQVNGGIKEAVKSRKNLLLWLFHVHNDINSRNGKHIYSTEESVESVSKFMKRVRGSGKDTSLPTWATAIIAVGALVGGIGIGVGIQKSSHKE